MVLPELNPHHWSTFASVLLSLPLFYLVGQFFMDRSQNPILSIGSRMAIGMLVSLSVLATIYTTGETGFIFYLMLFIAIGVKRKFQPDTSDLPDLGWKRGLLLAVMITGFTVVEGYRADVLVEDGVYVGNSDVAYYGSYGLSLFQNGVETNPEKLTPEKTPTLYHFGDLWLSGVYSCFFNVLPYYAYILVARILMMVVLLMMVYGWSRQLGGGAVVSGLVSFIFLFAVYLKFFEVDTGDISILRFFTFYYPAYCNPSHMIVGVGALPFLLMRAKGSGWLSVVGLWFLPFLNGGILVVPIVASVTYSLCHVYIRYRSGDQLSQKILFEHAGLFIVSVIPFIYYQLTGRMFSSSGLELSLNQVYLTAHTMVRALLSYGFILPFFLGLLPFARSRNENKKDLFLLSISLVIGTVAAFSVIFPILQGNTSKILSIHFTAILVPVCLIGLAKMSSQKATTHRVLSLLALLLIAFQTVRMVSRTDMYQLTFDWSTYQDDYRERVMISPDEYSGLSHAFSRNGQNVGYFMYNEEESYGGVHYSNFTPWKGIFPGTVFFRMNISTKDTLISAEQLNYLKLTALGQFAYRLDFDSAKVSDAMLDYLEPEFIIRPRKGDYVFPQSLASVYSDSIELNEYVLYKK